MIFDIEGIKQDYNNKRGWREAKKYAFAIGTLGLGALYLWATTLIVREGEMGLRRDARGKMTLLPPGRHSNFPWEDYPVNPMSLSEEVVRLGPYTIVTVHTGKNAKTYNNGILDVLSEGQHLLDHANWTLDKMISIKQETKKLSPVIASTQDNVSIRLNGDLRYQITDPKLAIQSIHDIDKSLAEIAEMNITRIVSQHCLADFMRKGASSTTQESGMSLIINQLMHDITEALSALGIQLLNIGLTSWSVNDKDLAHELGHGAVMQSKTNSKLLSAQREAEVMGVEAEAKAAAEITKAKGDADAISIRAQAEARAITLRGQAFNELGALYQTNAPGLKMYTGEQTIALVKGANNPNLFFYAGRGAEDQSIQLTLPVLAGSLDPR